MLLPAIWGVEDLVSLSLVLGGWRVMLLLGEVVEKDLEALLWWLGLV